MCITHLLWHELDHDSESQDLPVLLPPLELVVVEELGQPFVVHDPIFRVRLQGGVLNGYVQGGRSQHRYRADGLTHIFDRVLWSGLLDEKK